MKIKIIDGQEYLGAYGIRNIPLKLWVSVKQLAASKCISVRQLILNALQFYLDSAK